MEGQPATTQNPRFVAWARPLSTRAFGRVEISPVTSPTDWTILAHGPLEPLAENVCWLQGSLPRISLKRTMTVARLGDGRLVIHNGIAIADIQLRQLEAFGTPAFLIVPNGFHRQDAAAYKRRYPELTVLAPRGARAKVEEQVAVDGALEDFPPDDTVRFEMLGGVAEREGAMLVRSSDGITLVLTDALFNMDRKRDVLGFLFTTLMGSAPGPRVSRLAKLIFIQDRAALRRDFERYADLPDLQRLVVAHEKVATGPAARAALLAAAAFL